jgi:hypothetical protein
MMGRIFQELITIAKEQEGRGSNENDQEETRTERRVIGEEELEKCIQKTKNNKASGEDGIMAKVRRRRNNRRHTQINHYDTDNRKYATKLEYRNHMPHSKKGEIH